MKVGGTIFSRFLGAVSSQLNKKRRRLQENFLRELFQGVQNLRNLSFYTKFQKKEHPLIT